MPRYMAPFVERDRHRTAFKEVYELNLLDPYDAQETVPEPEELPPQAVLPAFVTPELDESHIAPGLALMLGAKRAGDIVEVVIQEVIVDEAGSKVSTFSLPIVANPASAAQGPLYVQIGMDDLNAFFTDKTYTAAGNDRFMVLNLHELADRECQEVAG